MLAQGPVNDFHTTISQLQHTLNLALSTTTHLPPCPCTSHCLVTCPQEVSKLRAALSRATAAATDKEAALGEARAQLARLGGQLEAAQGEAAALRRQLDSERCDHQVGVRRCGLCWECMSLE